MPSKIEWTDETWSPVTGCTPVSPACKNCYAARMAKRLKAMGVRKYANGFQVTVHEDVLEQPLHWKKPRMCFLNSMSDTFHDDVPADFIYEEFAVMALCPQHTFQVLTKRPPRMKHLLEGDSFGEDVGWIARAKIKDSYDQPQSEKLQALISTPLIDGDSWPLPNVWLGVTAEDQQRADERIPILLKTPAAVRFLSLEPLLGPIDLTRIPCGHLEHSNGIHKLVTFNALEVSPDSPAHAERSYGHGGVSQVIVGPETGPGARPMNLDWARSIRDQCQAAGVPFFYKRGELDGRIHHEMPEVAR